MWKFIKLLFRKNRLVYILERDSETGGYISHFEQYPDTYAQGETPEEAQFNLISTLIAVIQAEKAEKEGKEGKRATLSKNENYPIRRELPLQVV